MIETLEAVQWAQWELAERVHRVRTSVPPQFRIHGWRWHQAALLRDATRFRERARQATCDAGAGESRQALVRAFRWLADYNLRDFHLLENEVFYPFLLRKLPDRERAAQLTQLGRSRQERIEARMRELRHHLQVFTGNDARECVGARNRIEWCAEQLLEDMATGFTEQQMLIVPLVARTVSVKDQQAMERIAQHRLNWRQKRVHLVSFYEAIRSNPEELRIFRAHVPGFARLLLHTWRTHDYLPLTNALDAPR
ncbi:hypothetical protein CDCA_CDCA11G3314 [Cyanidium caldarium]|uniref:Hemerythrin-like domain-containing protein n=1 Tax=Cyanidium caldarium TaxID=2771 RepID=A0AAV9IYX4_CYACA|nr:hypothetical protein CDCA_CDCA11G3314 [Cyanidium caldarium]